MSELSWKPVRQGREYCSSGCGRGCTYAEYTSAVRAGHRLACRLGKGWKPVVWENLGWHYKVVDKSGFLKVSSGKSFPRKTPHYTAYLGADETGGRWAETASTPAKAIELVRRQAEIELALVDKLVACLPKRVR